MNRPLVAIVVPVFNGAEHLAECLESILAQTYPNWRAVVMDNCSTDGTGAIADDFARRDSRLRVVHCEKFVGRTENYNRAVAHADDCAEYIKIVEADNWITEDSLDRTVGLAAKDIGIGMVSSYSLTGRRVGLDGLAYSEQVMAGVDVIRLLYLNSTYLFGAPTNLLFRAKALRDETVCFHADVCSEDADLCMRVLRKWSFGFVHQVLAFVRLDDTGAYSKIRDFDHRPAWMYFAIQAYGGDYFNGNELLEIRRTCERRYFDCLGRAIVTGRSKAYWDFHRGLFRAAGMKLRLRDIFVPAARNLIDLALNPKSTIEKLVKPRRRRWRR